jgi:hypothetical protein
MHHYIRMQLSALAPSPSRPGHAGRHLISGIFHRAVCCAAMCRSRGPPPASSSPLAAYSSPAAHRITPLTLTSPLYLPLSEYILVEKPPPTYTQRLDWVSGHHMTREQHASLSPAAQSRQSLRLLNPGEFEYLPAKHQHSSVQHPPPRCVSREQRACIEDTHLE